MLTDPGVDRGAAHSGSERLSGAFSVGDREGWPTAIVGLICLTMACQHGKAHQAYRLRPIIAHKLPFNFLQPHAAKCRSSRLVPTSNRTSNLTNGHTCIGVRFRLVSVQVRPLAACHDLSRSPITTTTAYAHLESYRGRSGAPRGLTLCERFSVARSERQT